MADDVVLNPGSGGDTVAADEIASKKYQRIKLIHGSDGVNAGDVASGNPLPVVDAAAETSLASIDGKTPPLGQALAAASVPSVLPQAQVTALTPPAAITGFALEVTQAAMSAKIPALGQALAAGSLPTVLPADQIAAITPPAAITGFATSTKQSDGTQKTQVVDGSGNVVGATSNALDINIKSGNPTSITANAGTNLNTSALATESTLDARTGALTETAPVSDTASSGMNGRLQRIAQRITSLITALGSPFQAGGSIGNTTFGSTVADGSNVALGAKTDDKNAATNTTAVSVISLLKQISAYLSGSLTVASHAVTNAGTFPVQAAGDVAHDTADSGAPAKIGAKASIALSALTLVADADRTNLFAGIDGVQIVRPHCNLEDIVSGNASNTDGTSTQCIAAQASGIKTYLTSVILTNTSAAMIYVEIKDGTTVKATIPVPATGGAIFNPPVPIPGSAATAWNFDPSAAATTVICSMIGFKSKV